MQPMHASPESHFHRACFNICKLAPKVFLLGGIPLKGESEVERFTMPAEKRLVPLGQEAPIERGTATLHHQILFRHFSKDESLPSSFRAFLACHKMSNHDGLSNSIFNQSLSLDELDELKQKNLDSIERRIRFVVHQVRGGSPSFLGVINGLSEEYMTNCQDNTEIAVSKMYRRAQEDAEDAGDINLKLQVNKCNRALARFRFFQHDEAVTRFTSPEAQTDPSIQLPLSFINVGFNQREQIPTHLRAEILSQRALLLGTDHPASMAYPSSTLFNGQHAKDIQKHLLETWRKDNFKSATDFLANDDNWGEYIEKIPELKEEVARLRTQYENELEDVLFEPEKLGLADEQIQARQIELTCAIKDVEKQVRRDYTCGFIFNQRLMPFFESMGVRDATIQFDKRVLGRLISTENRMVGSKQFDGAIASFPRIEKLLQFNGPGVNVLVDYFNPNAVRQPKRFELNHGPMSQVRQFLLGSKTVSQAGLPVLMNYHQLKNVSALKPKSRNQSDAVSMELHFDRLTNPLKDSATWCDLPIKQRVLLFEVPVPISGARFFSAHELKHHVARFLGDLRRVGYDYDAGDFLKPGFLGQRGNSYELGLETAIRFCHALFVEYKGYLPSFYDREKLAKKVWRNSATPDRTSSVDVDEQKAAVIKFAIDPDFSLGKLAPK